MINTDLELKTTNIVSPAVLSFHRPMADWCLPNLAQICRYCSGFVYTFVTVYSSSFFLYIHVYWWARRDKQNNIKASDLALEECGLDTEHK